MIQNGLSILSLLGSLALGGPGGGSIDSIALRPYLTTDQDDATVRVCGEVWGLFYGAAQASTSVNGFTIDLDVQVFSNTQYPYVDTWCVDAPVGALSAGSYAVSVHLTVNDAPIGTEQTSASVVPGRFCWGSKATLTSDGASDSFPAAVVFNDRLYLFWTKTYEGRLVGASYDGTSWSSAVSIADSTTRSAVGAAVLDGRIHLFYSRSLGYPVSHLFTTSSTDGVNWSAEQEITAGDVYDDYGATTTIHNGLVYVLWKRWQSDGFRYIYSMTYDGVSFGPPTQLWADEYIDSPVSAASFLGKLYVFYGGGVRYRSFDGVSWSAEGRASNAPPLAGSTGGSPASVVVNGRLVLVVVSVDSLLYEVDFDGATWTESRVSADQEADQSLLNLGAALFHGELHLFWGGGYWIPEGELSSRRFTDVDGDTVADRCDVCPSVPDPDQIDEDADAHGAACDCDDEDAATYPGALETNDGLDNQCAGDEGYGSVDEISGTAGFPNPGDTSGYCWPKQIGATAYEAKRSICSTMCSSCESYVTAGRCWNDAANPPAGSRFYYLVHPTAPHVGSWGRTSAGVERTVCP